MITKDGKGETSVMYVRASRRTRTQPGDISRRCHKGGPAARRRVRVRQGVGRGKGREEVA